MPVLAEALAPRRRRRQVLLVLHLKRKSAKNEAKQNCVTHETMKELLRRARVVERKHKNSACINRSESPPPSGGHWAVQKVNSFRG